MKYPIPFIRLKFRLVFEQKPGFGKGLTSMKLVGGIYLGSSARKTKTVAGNIIYPAGHHHFVRHALIPDGSCYLSEFYELEWAVPA